MDVLDAEQRAFISKAIEDLLNEYGGLLETEETEFRTGPNPYWDMETHDEVKSARKALEMLK